MRVSIWGYGFLFLISIGLLLINIFGNMTKDNEPNYYLVKEVTEKALIDAVDITAYRVGIGYDGITQENASESMHYWKNRTNKNYQRKIYRKFYQKI